MTHLRIYLNLENCTHIALLNFSKGVDLCDVFASEMFIVSILYIYLIYTYFYIAPVNM